MPSESAKKNIPFLSYLWRTWPLLVFTVAANFLTRWNHAFAWISNGKDEWGNTVWQGLTAADLCGAVLYVPALASVVIWLVGLMIHLFHRQTVERDAHSGRTGTDWETVTAAERVRWSVILRLGYALIFGLIAAALAK